MEKQVNSNQSTCSVGESETKFVYVNNPSQQRLQKNFMLQAQQNQDAFHAYLRVHMQRQSENNLNVNELLYNTSYQEHPHQNGFGTPCANYNTNFPLRTDPFGVTYDSFPRQQLNSNLQYGNVYGTTQNAKYTTEANVQRATTNNVNIITPQECKNTSPSFQSENLNTINNKPKSILKKSSKYSISAPALLQVSSDALITQKTSRNPSSILTKRASETDLETYEQTNACRSDKSSEEVENRKKRWKSTYSSFNTKESTREEGQQNFLQEKHEEKNEVFCVDDVTEHNDMIVEEQANQQVKGKPSKGVEWGVVCYYRYNSGIRGSDHFFNRKELKSFRDLAGVLHKLGDVKNPNHHLIYMDNDVDRFLNLHVVGKNNRTLNASQLHQMEGISNSEEEKSLPSFSSSLNGVHEDYLCTVYDGRLYFCVELVDDDFHSDSLQQKKNFHNQYKNSKKYQGDPTFDMIAEEMDGILSDENDNNGIEEYIDIESMNNDDISEDNRSSDTVSLEDLEEEIDVEDCSDERKESHEIHIDLDFCGGEETDIHGEIFTPMSSPQNCTFHGDRKQGFPITEPIFSSSEETVVEEYTDPKSINEIARQLSNKMSSYRQKNLRTKKESFRRLQVQQLASSGSTPVKLMKVKSKQEQEDKRKPKRLTHQDSFQIQRRQNISANTLESSICNN